jgi:Uma2 family endonuclease
MHSPVAHLPVLRAFTVDEVYRMVEAGVLRENEPVELIDGRLVLVSPQGPLHSVTTIRFADALRAVLAPGEGLREEKPLACPPSDLPEPDVCVARGSLAAWATAHPTGQDALLVVEVAVTSQAEDQRKAATYARAGVLVYWVVDVPGRTVEVHEGPLPSGKYRTVRLLGEDDSLEWPSHGWRARVSDLLP